MTEAKYDDLSRRLFPPALAPGAAFYVTGEDSLRVLIANTLAGIVVTVRGRVCAVDGQVLPFEKQIVPASDGSTGSTDIDLGEGWVLNVDAIVTTGAPSSSQTFITLSIIRGTGTPAIELATLSQGFATSTLRVFWPWAQQVASSSTGASSIGLMKLVTTPAAGADFSQAVPASKTWRLRSVAGRLVTSAVAGTRDIRLVIDDGSGNVFFESRLDSDQVASKDYRHFWTPELEAAIITSGNFLYYKVPANVLPAGALIRSLTAGILAGDQWSEVCINVEEF